MGAGGMAGRQGGSGEGGKEIFWGIREQEGEQGGRAAPPAAPIPHRRQRPLHDAVQLGPASPGTPLTRMNSTASVHGQWVDGEHLAQKAFHAASKR